MTPLLILLPSRPTSTGFLSSLIYTSVPAAPTGPCRAAAKRLLPFCYFRLRRVGVTALETLRFKAKAGEL